jgi:hypothetical protein
MDAETFAFACRRERDSMLALYSDASTATEVSGKLASANLSGAQKAIVLDAIGTILTDVFYSIILALDGASSLGGLQQNYRLLDEQGETISQGNGALEAAAFKAFQSD